MSTDSIPFLVFLCLPVGSVALFFVRRHLQHRSFVTLGAKLGLEYYKWELMDFPTNILDPLGSWDKAQNVYRGRIHDGVVMFFTIEQGFGRQAYERTIVARRYDGVVPAAPEGFAPPVQILEYGRWRVVTRVRPFLGSALMKNSTIERALALLQ